MFLILKGAEIFVPRAFSAIIVFARLKYFLLFATLVWLAKGSAFPQPSDPQHPDGSYKELYASGAVKEKGHYRHSAKQGTWYYYAENGNIEKKEKYKNGEVRWRIFYRKGKVIKTIDRNGKVKVYPGCGC